MLLFADYFYKLINRETMLSFDPIRNFSKLTLDLVPFEPRQAGMDCSSALHDSGIGEGEQDIDCFSKTDEIDSGIQTPSDTVERVDPNATGPGVSSPSPEDTVEDIEGYDKIRKILFVPHPLRNIGNSKNAHDTSFLTIEEARQILVQLDLCINRKNEYVYSTPVNADHPGIFRIGVWSYDDLFQFTEINVRKLFRTLPPINGNLRILFEYNCSGVMDAAKALKEKYHDKVNSIRDLAQTLKANLRSTMGLLKKELTDSALDKIQNFQCDCLTVDFDELQEMIQSDFDLVNANLIRNGKTIRDFNHQPEEAAFFFFQTLDFKHFMKVQVADPNFGNDFLAIRYFYHMQQLVLREHSIYLSKFMTAIISLRSTVDALNASYDKLIDSVSI